jgi:signal peptidase II
MQSKPIFDLLAGGGIFLLDQQSKRMVQARATALSLPLRIPFKIHTVIHHERIYRHAGGQVLLVLLWLIALASTIVLYQGGTWFQSPLPLCGMAVALGSAASNLFDILRRRHIVNFIDLGWWPAFNLADVGIIVGLFIAFLT